MAEATEICVTTDEELIDVVRDGAVNRSVAATGMNEGSSRSHSALTITLKQRNLETQGTKIGKLVLVDLAGSEMVLIESISYCIHLNEHCIGAENQSFGTTVGGGKNDQ